MRQLQCSSNGEIFRHSEIFRALDESRQVYNVGTDTCNMVARRRTKCTGISYCYPKAKVHLEKRFEKYNG